MVKNLALMTHITTEVDEAPVIRTAFNSGVEDIRILGGRPINNPKVFMVFINGNILGVTYGYQRLIKVTTFGWQNEYAMLMSAYLYRISDKCVVDA